jgi:hypothetical protein
MYQKVCGGWQVRVRRNPKMLRNCKIGLLSGALLALTFSGLSSSAQTSQHNRSTKHWPRLLSFSEGKAILEVAWQHRSNIDFDFQPDCSHLVHDIYSLVGLEYEYAPSRDFYRNEVTEFRRVFHPQPGDLIVWLGHVGIVVSPLEHSFYSSLNSGLLVDNYLKRYWRNRGTPRFYRYRMLDQVQRVRFDIATSLMNRAQSGGDDTVMSPFTDIE